MHPPTPSVDIAHGSRRAVRILYGIFFVSGLCGLVYESIWSHYLKLLLGHAAYGQAVVLVVFVGGLALGAWWTGRISERIRQPILAYAIVELAVAAIAFAFHQVFLWASEWSIQSLLPAMCSPGAPCLANWLLAGALILLPSILLGSTFPLMSAGVIRLGVQPGRGLSLLYFLNSAGAAVGVLTAGYLLVPTLGLPGTLLVAATLNCLVATAAYLATRSVDAGAFAQPAPLQQASAAQFGLLLPLLLVAALTGLSSFIYEIVWIRMLTLVLGAATHSFELMLATFIGGLALGAWWIRDRVDKFERPEYVLAAIQVVMGLAAVITLPLYLGCFEAMSMAMRSLSRTDSAYVLFNIANALLAAAVMLPATICAGMTLPLITALLLRKGYGERQIGQVYGVNTLGAIGGVLLAVHVLMPLLGVKWALAVGAFIDIALGAWLWLYSHRRSSQAGPKRSLRLPAAALAAAAAAALLLPLLVPLGPKQMASGVFRHGVPVQNDDVLFHKDGKTATVSVLERKSGERSLLTNGKVDGSSHPLGGKATPDDNTVVLLGALGLLHQPQARRAAVIGLGTGITSAVVLESNTLESLETIEIEPMMVEAAQMFRPKNEAVFTDSRSRIIVDDARAHFAKTRASYDIVVSEPSNPWVSGVSGLFTTEFYRTAARQLARDGVFVQWVQLYEVSPEVASSILRAFASVFPVYRVYLSTDSDMILVARNGAKAPDADFSLLDRTPKLAARLGELGIRNAATLAAHEVSRPDVLAVLASSYGAPPNSDFFPYVDNRASKDRFQGLSGQALVNFDMAPVPMFEFVHPPPAYLGQIHFATTHMPREVLDVASARNGLRYLRGEQLLPHESALFGSIARDYELVRGWMETCKFPAAHERLWDAMVLVAADITPGLPTVQAREFWRGVLNGKCRTALSGAQKAWIELFASIASRDADATRRRADEVLANPAGLTTEQRQYALLAAVVGRVARSAPANELRALFFTHAQHIPPANLELPWFRYIRMLLGTREVPAKQQP